MIEYQKWACLNGCGEHFYTSKIFKKRKPLCPNCEERKSVKKIGHYFLNEIKKDEWGMYKSKIKNHE